MKQLCVRLSVCECVRVCELINRTKFAYVGSAILWPLDARRGAFFVLCALMLQLPPLLLLLLLLLIMLALGGSATPTRDQQAEHSSKFPQAMPTTGCSSSPHFPCYHSSSSSPAPTATAARGAVRTPLGHSGQAGRQRGGQSSATLRQRASPVGAAEQRPPTAPPKGRSRREERAQKDRERESGREGEREGAGAEKRLPEWELETSFARWDDA